MKHKPPKDIYSKRAAKYKLGYLMKALGAKNQTIQKWSEKFGLQITRPADLFNVELNKYSLDLLISKTTENVISNFYSIGFYSEIDSLAGELAKIELNQRGVPATYLDSDNPRFKSISKEYELLKRTKEVEINRTLYELIEDLAKGPETDFLRLCYMLEVFNGRISTKNEIIKEGLLADFYSKNFDLNITSALPLGVNLSQGKASDVRIVTIHDEQKSTVKSASQESEFEQLRNLCFAEAIYDIISSKPFGMNQNEINQFYLCARAIRQIEPGSNKPMYLKLHTGVCDTTMIVATHFEMMGIEKIISRYDQRILRQHYLTVRKAYDLMKSVSPDKNPSSIFKEYLQKSINIYEDTMHLTWQQVNRILEYGQIQKEKESNLNIFDLSSSNLVNVISVNIVYTYDGNILLQKRKEASPDGYSYHVSAADYIRIPDCYGDIKYSHMPSILYTMASVTEKQMGMSFYDTIPTERLAMTGLVRERNIGEVGILGYADIGADIPGYVNRIEPKLSDIIRPTNYNSTHIDDFIAVPFEPDILFMFILRHASHKNGIFKPWSDFHPLGACAIIHALCNRWPTSDVITSWDYAREKYIKDEFVNS